MLRTSMKTLWLVAFLFVSADAGMSRAEFRDIVLAEARCMDSDGGVPAVRVGDCVVTCVGEDATVALVDGGVCLLPHTPLQPTQVGDFWTPGSRPSEQKRR